MRLTILNHVDVIFLPGPLIWLCVFVFVCCWPPSRPVCPNYEVVEFQPWTVTDPDLGSGANAYTIYMTPSHL